MGLSSVFNYMRGILSCGDSVETSLDSYPSTETSDLVLRTWHTASKKVENMPFVAEQVQEWALKLRILQAKAERSESKANQALLEATRATFAVRPSHIYPVKVYHNDVTWVCESSWSEHAVGCGDSPHAAMQAFDDMWIGDSDASMDG